MTIRFSKYHGAGNDFIMIDSMDNPSFNVSDEWIRRACHRRFGIGADGVIVIYSSEKYDFKMKYYNSDGFEGTMCGNGGRCITAFAKNLGKINHTAHFEAIDGVHQSEILTDGEIKLKMRDISKVEIFPDGYLLNTGSPHFVRFVNEITNINVFEEGRKIRNEKRFLPGGVNVNFAAVKSENSISLYTYERGVEDETLSCGTGAVASAIAFGLHNKKFVSPVFILAKGGKLSVSFKENKGQYCDIWLQGPATQVFDGDFK